MVKSFRKIYHKRILERKSGLRGQELGMGIRCHFHKRGHIQYTYNKLKRDLQNLKLLKEMKRPTTEVGDDEKLKRNRREIPFENDDVLSNIVDKGLVMKANCDVDNGHVLLAKCDDDGD